MARLSVEVDRKHQRPTTNYQLEEKPIHTLMFFRINKIDHLISNELSILITSGK